MFNLLYGVSGRRPDRRVQGEGHSLSGDTRGGGPLPYPSGEPTTTEAERVVIVGYNRASPAVETATLRTGFSPLFLPLCFGPFRVLAEIEGKKPSVSNGWAQVSDLSAKGLRHLHLLSRRLKTKGKRKDVVMNLLCPTLIRLRSAAGFVGIGITFRWDTLGVPGRFHDWFYLGITVKEAAL